MLGWVGFVPNFSTCSGWVGLDWVSQLMSRVGSGHRKWTRGRLWAGAAAEPVSGAKPRPLRAPKRFRRQRRRRRLCSEKDGEQQLGRRRTTDRRHREGDHESRQRRRRLVGRIVSGKPGSVVQSAEVGSVLGRRDSSRTTTASGRI